VLAPLLVGIAAGYGVAIPVGAIAVLIVQTGIRRGFRAAAAAGAGAATADLIYAFAAVLAGSAIVAIVAPLLALVRLSAAATLVLIAAAGVRRGLRPLAEVEGMRDGSPLRTYGAFLALTLLNPSTMTYFLTFAIGLPQISTDLATRIAFAIGAFAASLSWQTLLAVVGSSLHTRITPRIELATALLSGAILLAFAAKIAADALAV